jgi:hypothetical protein
MINEIEDTSLNQSKEEDLTLVEIYEQWHSSLREALDEVNNLRNYLHYLANSPIPSVNYTRNFNFNSSTSTVPDLGYYPFAPFRPQYNEINIEETLRKTPQNTKAWYDEVSRRLKELDIAKQTILKFGILKKAKAEHR